MTETETGTSDAYSIRNDSLFKKHEDKKLRNVRKDREQLLEWQQLLQCDIMAVNDDGLWMHQKYGYSVPRRNGKSENVLARCLWGLKNGEKILYTHTGQQHHTQCGSGWIECAKKQESRYHHHLRRSERTLIHK